MPKISIVLPTYNVEKYISRALDSCINQTFSDIEIIVVDDCGNDKSIEIAKEFANHDERIKIIKNPQNLKLLHARANGVKHSNADYIMFLDPDDELELNACEVAYALVKDNMDAVFFGIKSIVRDCEKPINVYKDEIITPKEYMQRFSDFRWNLCGKLFKKSYYLLALNTLQTQNQINIAEDALLTYFLALNTKNNIAISSKYLYKYYEDVCSMTKVEGSEKTKSINIAYNKIIDIIQNYENKNDTFKKYYINRLEYEKYSFLRRLNKTNKIFLPFYFKIKAVIYRKLAKKYLKALKNKKIDFAYF